MFAERHVLFAGSELPWIGNAPPSVKSAGVDVANPIESFAGPDPVCPDARLRRDVVRAYTWWSGCFADHRSRVRTSVHGVSLAAGLFQRKELRSTSPAASAAKVLFVGTVVLN